jgi:hypothetical protein
MVQWRFCNCRRLSCRRPKLHSCLDVTFTGRRVNALCNNVGTDRVLGHLGGGLDYWITPRIGVFGEAVYDLFNGAAKRLAKRKHAPPVLRIEVSDSKRILRFHHKADCSKSTPDTMRCLRLIGDPNFIVLVRTGHKIDERRIEIHVVRH